MKKAFLTFRFLLSAFCLLQISFAQVKINQEDAPRFVYQTSVSSSYGVGKLFAQMDTFPNSNFSLEIHQVIAYQFYKYFFTGIGVGLDFWFCDKKTSTFIPFYANVTVKFINKKMAPFLFVNIGYSFKWQVQKKLEDNLFYGTKAGLFFQTGVGLNIKFSEKLSLLFSPYYKVQQSAIQYREEGSELLLAETKTQFFHFVGLRIGLLY
jgi:hypothetical protein